MLKKATIMRGDTNRRNGTAIRHNYSLVMDVIALLVPLSLSVLCFAHFAGLVNLLFVSDPVIYLFVLTNTVKFYNYPTVMRSLALV